MVAWTRVNFSALDAGEGASCEKVVLLRKSEMERSTKTERGVFFLMEVSS
jgi:hypothetical protein